MAEAGLDQVSLVDRLNALPAEMRKGRRRTISGINRLVLGQVRFVDPLLAADLEHVFGGKFTALDYLAFVAECVGTPEAA